ncbi:UNVERIFIED_CONTAM: hypothetical protein NCL1_63289 [Trichonephila clavipes]
MTTGTDRDNAPMKILRKRMPAILALKRQICYLSRFMEYRGKVLTIFSSEKEFQRSCQSPKLKKKNLDTTNRGDLSTSSSTRYQKDI